MSPSNGSSSFLARDSQPLTFFAAHFNTVRPLRIPRPRAGEFGAANVGSCRRMSPATPGRIKVSITHQCVTLLNNPPFRNGRRPKLLHVPVVGRNARHPASQNSSTWRFLTLIYSAGNSYVSSEGAAVPFWAGRMLRQTNESETAGSVGGRLGSEPHLVAIHASRGGR
jgi:hypothetical protein